MRKIFIVASIMFFLIGCSGSKNNKDGVIEIREKFFLGQVNDIYLNPDDYIGRTIKLEGLFMNSQADNGEDPFYAVYRYGPGGCCGIDGIVGFEAAWPDNITKEYPENDSWVEAVGELKKKNLFLYIDLVSLNVLDKRGQEFITR